MDETLLSRLRGQIARKRKAAAEVGPMHSAWEDIHDLEALLRALEWQPIETAPRDGSWVLLKGGESYDPPDDQHYPCVVGFWDGSLPGWWFCWWDSNWRSSYENPTHWRSIPLDT